MKGNGREQQRGKGGEGGYGPPMEIPGYAAAVDRFQSSEIFRLIGYKYILLIYNIPNAVRLNIYR
jgi:hypothetical protein